MRNLYVICLQSEISHGVYHELLRGACPEILPDFAGTGRFAQNDNDRANGLRAI